MYVRLMKIKTKQNEIQSGRSMIEMLGVLAIVGVLSVGALAGYSMAMTNYEANKTADEIRSDLIGIMELFSDRNNYDELPTTSAGSASFLVQAGVFEKTTNYLGTSKYAVPYNSTPSGFRYRYGIPNDKIKSVCRKILLKGWQTEIGDNLITITVYNGSSSFYLKTTETDEDKTIPVTFAGANRLCEVEPDSYFTLFFTIIK